MLSYNKWYYLNKKIIGVVLLGLGGYAQASESWNAKLRVSHYLQSPSNSVAEMAYYTGVIVLIADGAAVCLSSIIGFAFVSTTRSFYLVIVSK